MIISDRIRQVKLCVGYRRAINSRRAHNQHSHMDRTPYVAIAVEAIARVTACITQAADYAAAKCIEALTPFADSGCSGVSLKAERFCTNLRTATEEQSSAPASPQRIAFSTVADFLWGPVSPFVVGHRDSSVREIEIGFVRTVMKSPVWKDAKIQLRQQHWDEWSINWAASVADAAAEPVLPTTTSWFSWTAPPNPTAFVPAGVDLRRRAESFIASLPDMQKSYREWFLATAAALYASSARLGVFPSQLLEQTIYVALAKGDPSLPIPATEGALRYATFLMRHPWGTSPWGASLWGFDATGFQAWWSPELAAPVSRFAVELTAAAHLCNPNATEPAASPNSASVATEKATHQPARTLFVSQAEQERMFPPVGTIARTLDPSSARYEIPSGMVELLPVSRRILGSFAWPSPDMEGDLQMGLRHCQLGIIVWIDTSVRHDSFLLRSEWFDCYTVPDNAAMVCSAVDGRIVFSIPVIPIPQ